MCTAAGRKFQRVQLSISYQGVLTLPRSGLCDWALLNGLVVQYPVMSEKLRHCVIVINKTRIGLHQTLYWRLLD